jgi:hypothetical protein
MAPSKELLAGMKRRRLWASRTEVTSAEGGDVIHNAVAAAGDGARPGAVPGRDPSEGTNVLGFVALASGANVELDTLAFLEGLEAAGLDRREVNEHVGPVFA